jgi:hypothetical protein
MSAQAAVAPAFIPAYEPEHELARTLRSLPQYRTIPLVAVTGFDLVRAECRVS